MSNDNVMLAIRTILETFENSSDVERVNELHSLRDHTAGECRALKMDLISISRIVRQGDNGMSHS